MSSIHNQSISSLSEYDSTLRVLNKFIRIMIVKLTLFQIKHKKIVNMIISLLIKKWLMKMEEPL